jgi:hypothetical protein
VVTIKVQTRLLHHWGQIAITQEALAHGARAELERRLPTALRTGAGLDLELELHPSMLASAASATAIDALYAEVRALTGISEALRDEWRCKGTPRYAQVYETLRRGFLSKEEWRADLKWLYRDQRDRALHPETGFHVPESHPLGVETSPEYVVYRSENATRAVDIMLDVLATCAAAPRSPLAGWANEPTRTLIRRLVDSQRP